MTDGIKTNAQGIPRWLVVAFATKMVLVVLIVAAVVWWAAR